MLFIKERFMLTLFPNSAKCIAMKYSIEKIVKEINNLAVLRLKTKVDWYQSKFTIWKSENNLLPAAWGANSFDIFVIDEKYSHDFKKRGHCEVWDIFRLENNNIWISSYVLSEVKKRVTLEQFKNLLVWCFIKSYNANSGNTLLADHRNTIEYLQKPFGSFYEQMLYDLKYTKDYHKDMKDFLVIDIKLTINEICKSHLNTVPSPGGKLDLGEWKYT